MQIIKVLPRWGFCPKIRQILVKIGPLRFSIDSNFRLYSHQLFNVHFPPFVAHCEPSFSLVFSLLKIHKGTLYIKGKVICCWKSGTKLVKEYSIGAWSFVNQYSDYNSSLTVCSKRSGPFSYRMSSVWFLTILLEFLNGF